MIITPTLQAMGVCDGTAQVWADGCVLAKSATGVYTCTLDQELDANDGMLQLSLLGNSGIIRYANTSDSVKTISTFAVDGTTATDKAFSVSVWRRPAR